MYCIRQSGGICLILELGSNQIHEVLAIPTIQFIIGECKDNNLLCGRIAIHMLTMKDLCRDYNISPDDGYDFCIGKQLTCKLRTKETIVGKSRKGLDAFTFSPIDNCFSILSFGGCQRNSYGITPAEILPPELYYHIADGMQLIFTESSISEMSKTTAIICNKSRHQSERDIPYLRHFKTKLMSFQ